MEKTALDSEPQKPEIREKRCAACGEPFACHAGNCWCDAVSLTPDARARLQAEYADCLCPSCLRRNS